MYFLRRDIRRGIHDIDHLVFVAITILGITSQIKLKLYVISKKKKNNLALHFHFTFTSFSYIQTFVGNFCKNFPILYKRLIKITSPSLLATSSEFRTPNILWLVLSFSHPKTILNEEIFSLTYNLILIFFTTNVG